MVDIVKRKRKQLAVKDAEEKGIVADSMDVRRNLLEQFHDGKLTLCEMQDQLKQIKKSASKNGLKTRSQIYNNS